MSHLTSLTRVPPRCSCLMPTNPYLSYLFPSKSSEIVMWIGDIVDRFLSIRQGLWHWICNSFLQCGPYLIIFCLSWCMSARWILRDCNRIRLRWWGRQKWLILQYFSLHNYFDACAPKVNKNNNVANLWWPIRSTLLQSSCQCHFKHLCWWNASECMVKNGWPCITLHSYVFMLKTFGILIIILLHVLP